MRWKSTLIGKHKNIFLIDSCGALLTGLLLFLVLRPFNDYFSIPKAALTYLSVIALLFSFYSIACFFLLNNHWKPYLIIIIVANVLYCLLTFGLLVYYHQSITLLGIAYFLGEIVIIGGLVFIELQTISNHN